MGVQITTAMVQQYTTNTSMLLQQQGSRLRPYVQEHAFMGNAATYMEQFGQASAVKNQARNSDTPIVGVNQDRRWVFPSDFDWAELVDNEDRLRLLIDPLGPFTTAGAWALGRAIDDVIIDGFFNVNYTGQNGTTATAKLSAYNSNSQVVGLTVGSTGNAGLNVAKLRAAKLLLLAAEVDIDNDELFVAVTAKAHDNMLNELQATNLDYTDRPVLTEGRIKSFMGFNFVHSERVPGGASYAGSLVPSTEVASAAYLLPCWAKSGLGLGVWNDIQASVDRRPDKRNSMQVYVTGTYAATRLEEKRCVVIPTV